MIRRASRPGVHGKRHRRPGSEYGEQLKEMQRFKYSYGLRGAQLRRVFVAAAKNPGVTGEMFTSLLERRLDNVVYRLGLAASRSVARQLVGHGHIMVNGRKTTIPSYLVKKGDHIRFRPESKDHPLFVNIPERLKNYEPPSWLHMNPETLEGEVVSLPRDMEAPFDVNLVVDYYSKMVK